MSSVASVHVVIPARDEEARLDGCLRSVQAATAALLSARPSITAGIVVVLDRCVDRSADIAQAWGTDVFAIDVGSVGAARRAGLERVQAVENCPPDRVWIATTDADTVVPRSWLLDHVRLAELGHDLVVGRVQPDPAELSSAALAAWRSRDSGVERPAHGANLGFRLSAYREVGGFPEVSEHEDVALIRAIQVTGRRWTTGSLVTTSARLRGRTPGGFAGYLRALALELDV